MILPKEIKTRHKIRDTKIIQLFLDGKPQHVIAKEFNITQQRVHQILYVNRHLLLLDKNYEKAKRINYLKSQLYNEDGTMKPSEADGAELVEQLRKEYEGDHQVSVISQFFTIRPPKNISNRLTEAISNPE